MILAQDTDIVKPTGVDNVVVVAAYNSAAALNQDFSIRDVDDHLTAQAYLLSRWLAVPDIPEEVLLRETIKLKLGRPRDGARLLDGNLL